MRFAHDVALDAEYSLNRDAVGVMVTFGREPLNDGTVVLGYTLRAHAEELERLVMSRGAAHFACDRAEAAVAAGQRLAA